MNFIPKSICIIMVKSALEKFFKTSE